MKNKRAFTLIEILLVIGIIVLLAGAVIVAINPGRQFAKARDTQRTTDVNAILSGIVQNMTDNQGRWSCTTSLYYANSLPTTTVTIVTATETDATQINLSCLAPTYLPRIPIDPRQPSNSTNTAYTLVSDPTSGRITVCAQGEITNPICTQR